MSESQELTGHEAGLSGDEQIRIALQEIISNGGVATIDQIYQAVGRKISPIRLSVQGRASLRFFVNKVAVQAGYIYPYDKSNPGWRITPEGREYISNTGIIEEVEEVVNVDTKETQKAPANAVRGAAFERYVLSLLKKIYPNHTWFHQGERKSLERGLDFVGTRLGEADSLRSIGVQVKFHNPRTAPTQMEWLKFLAGCFAHRVNQSIFITTGQLTNDQRREANEANVLIIEGRDEVARIAEQHGISKFDLFDDENAEYPQ